MRYYINRYFYFGNITISRLKGMHVILKRYLHSTQGNLIDVIKQFQKLYRERNIQLAYNEGNDKIIIFPEFTSHLWSHVRGFISYYALAKVRKIMIIIDVSSVTVLKTCTASF